MVKRLRTWLFIVSVMAALLGPIVVGTLNHALDAKFQTISATAESGNPSQPVCIPKVSQAAYDELDKFVPGQEYDSVISLRMAELFAADQVVRQLPVNDIHKVNADDTKRRIEVLEYIQNGQIHTARDLVYAAYIFQHGDCSEHYRLGNRLAQVAMDTGYSDALWIYAATLDRYLMSLGKPQKFGTQYTQIDGEFKLYPVDPATTDAERARYNVPPLSEAIRNKPMPFTGSGASQRRWLETWWLTLIGAGFAFLSGVIGVVDAKPNALPGRMTLAIALVVYGISVFGHYTQINAVMQGTPEIQQRNWGIVNGLMIVVWLVFAVIEAFRFVKTKSAPDE